MIWGHGVVVCLGGPDGVGKSTLAASLQHAPGFSASCVFHSRPRVLPQRRGQPDEPQGGPHSRAAYGVVKSAAKLVCLLTDFIVGSWLRVAPVRRRGGLVVIERGWFDLLVDPGRYLLTVPAWLLKALSFFVPGPDLHIVLEAPADLVRARKQELTIDEIERQCAKWRALRHVMGPVVFIDATLATTEVKRKADKAISEVRTRRHGSLT